MGTVSYIVDEQLMISQTYFRCIFKDGLCLAILFLPISSLTVLNFLRPKFLDIYRKVPLKNTIKNTQVPLFYHVNLTYVNYFIVSRLLFKIVGA